MYYQIWKIKDYWKCLKAVSWLWRVSNASSEHVQPSALCTRLALALQPWWLRKSLAFRYLQTQMTWNDQIASNCSASSASWECKLTTWEHHLLRHPALDFVRTTLLCCFHALYLAKTCPNCMEQQNHNRTTKQAQGCNEGFWCLLFKAVFSRAKAVNFCIAPLWDVFSLQVWDQIAAGLSQDFPKSFRRWNWRSNLYNQSGP